MAYAIKYKFIFESINGAETEIDVLKDGYSGTPIQRPLGSAPVLRQQKNDRVSGSSLAFSPECHIDGEFTEFYTTDPKDYLVELYRAGTKIWSGFVTPELYSEPDIAPPYDVSVTATDGLGELKRYNFLPMGKATLHALFTNLLGYTGQSLPLNFISALRYSGVSASAFWLNTYINVDYKAGETCYDVLQYLLTTFNANISFYAGGWLVTRENDITVSSGKPNYITPSGGASQFTGGLMDITSMDGNGLWPVNFTSTSVDPAQNSIEVEAPWNLISGLVNSDMLSDTGWTKSNYTTYETNAGGYLLMPFNTLSQDILLPLGKPLLLTFYAAMYLYGTYLRKPYSEAELSIRFTAGGSTYSLATDEKGGLYWDVSGTSIINYKIETGTDRATADENQITIPVFLDDNGDPVSGTLSIQFAAGHYDPNDPGTQGLWLFGARLTIAAEKGYKDTLRLNNGARGAAPGVTIAIGFETEELEDFKPFYGGLLLDGNDDLVTELSTDHFSGLDFLSLISRDFARSIALPRLRTTGTLDTPASLVLRPLMLNHRGTLRWLETFEWNLFNDELDFAAVSVPTASISVGDEVIIATGSANGDAANTVGRITPGSSEGALTVMLSNYSHVFEADANGYAKLGTDTVSVRAFRGSTQVPTSVGTITGVLHGLSVTVQDDDTTSTSLRIAASRSLALSGSLDIPVTADGVTVTLRYGWTLAPEGDSGTDGYNTATVMLYQRAALSPSTPGLDTTYTFSTGVLSGTLGNWSQTPPAADGNPLWMIQAKAISRSNTVTIAPADWVGPVKYIEDGLPGARGKTPRGPTEWASGMDYQGVDGTGEFVDFVIDSDDPDTVYYCRKDHNSTNIPLSDTTYWSSSPLTDFVATKVLYSTLGYVQNLGVNILKVQTGGSVTGGMMPPQTDGNGNIIFWAGGSTPGTAPFTIDKDGNMKATSGTFAGFLQMPFEDIADAATYVSTRTYSLADKCNLSHYPMDTDDRTLILPTSLDQNGKVVNIFDFAFKTRLQSGGVKIQTTSGMMFIPGVTNGDWGLYPQTWIRTGRGGFVQLVAVKVNSVVYWVVTVNGLTGYTYGY